MAELYAECDTKCVKSTPPPKYCIFVITCIHQGSVFKMDQKGAHWILECRYLWEEEEGSGRCGFSTVMLVKWIRASGRKRHICLVCRR